MYHDMTVISVDDNTINLLLIEALAKELGIEVKSFLGAKEALKYMQAHKYDIILTDYMMPEMHGIEFIKEIRAINPDIPIVMITAISDDNLLKLEALEAGATEFLNKPLSPTEFQARLMNLIKLRKAQLMLQDKALFLEEEVRKAVKLVEDREHEALYVLGRASEYKDLETAQHINRVASYSLLIVKAMGGNEYEQKLIKYSAPLHDVGKIGIPDHILTKPGIYTADEFEIMKRHPLIGYEMLKEGKSPYLKSGAEIALTHHEKYNGTGYPYGLKGENIPLHGRILAIADVFDALTSNRPYKEAWPFEKAIDLLMREKGEHFDPKLVDIFVANVEKVREIYNSMSDHTPLC
jgi:putative two-component system response regulator